MSKTEPLEGNEEQDKFLHLYCQVCEFTSIVPKSEQGLTELCSMCMTDTGQRNVMQARIARRLDRVEGRDWRLPQGGQPRGRFK